jgi:protein-disulfide isomerase
MLLHHRHPLLEFGCATRWQARMAACLMVGVTALAVTGGLAEATQKPKVPAETEKAAFVPAPISDWPLGSEQAQVTLLEYGSLTCSHCADFNNYVLPSLKTKYVNTGRVRYVFRAFPTPPLGLAYPMHSLARCAGPKGYHRVLDAFFQQQKVIFEAAQQGKGAKDIVYSVFAEATGMNAAQADSCLRAQTFAEEVNQQLLKGEEMGVEGTPTLFIQTPKGVTRLSAPYDAENVGRALDEALVALPPPSTVRPAQVRLKATTRTKPKAKKP